MILIVGCGSGTGSNAGNEVDERELTPEEIAAMEFWSEQFQMSLVSDSMRTFEEENRVSPERERALAMGAFVLTFNRESIRVFPLRGSARHADSIMEMWGIESTEDALEILDSLSSDEIVECAVDEIFHFIIYHGWDEISHIMRNEDVPNLWAFGNAKEMLIEEFDFTEEELFEIPSLAAWYFGRVAVVARYGVEAGFLEEEDTWYYLERAANHASVIYNCWRQYTGAHILGRAIVYGNVDDFRDALRFLLNHEESPFKSIEFHD